MSEKDKFVDVRYHMNSGMAHYIVGNTKISHICLKNHHMFLFRVADHYPNFKPYYSHISFDGKYRMEC